MVPSTAKCAIYTDIGAEICQIETDNASVPKMTSNPLFHGFFMRKAVYFTE
jgi:hypothetical protein